jgi:hypothetical protein
MEYPHGFVMDSNLLYRLKKPLYCLKQVPQVWYAKIENLFLGLGFKRCEFDHSMYVLHSNRDTLIVIVYFYDLIITGNNNSLAFRLKKQIVDCFDMTNLGTLHYFLGLQVLPLCDGFFISQSKYVMDLLTHFKMDDCNPCTTPFHSRVKLTKTYPTPAANATLYRQFVDSLIYLTHSRPNISFDVSVVSQFM